MSYCKVCVNGHYCYEHDGKNLDEIQKLEALNLRYKNALKNQGNNWTNREVLKTYHKDELVELIVYDTVNARKALKEESEK